MQTLRVILRVFIKQIKGLKLILSVPFTFGSCCCEPTSCSQRSSPCKWNRLLLGFKHKTKIHQRERESRNIRSGQSNSLVHSEKKERRTGELCNIKRLRRPQRTKVMDDWRILFMVKKTPFTTSSQENTLQEADVSLLKSTIKRRFTRANTETSPQAANKARLDSKTSTKARALLEKHSLDDWN